MTLTACHQPERTFGLASVVCDTGKWVANPCPAFKHELSNDARVIRFEETLLRFGPCELKTRALAWT